MTITDYWGEMVTVSLLGTDRRDPPVPPAGGLADLAADNPQPTPSQRLLQQVSACAVAQRAGVLPGPSAPQVAGPPSDPRPLTPPSATATWRRIIGDWSVLEDEWVLAVIHAGRRVAPELVVPLLTRHRTDPVRHARAMVAAGPLGTWMIEWSPRLACSSRKAAPAESIAELPELSITPDLVGLLAAPPLQVADTISHALSSGALKVSHRAVLVNLVARVRRDALAELADALDRVDPSRPAIGLAFALADLARLRHRMLTELEPA